MLKDFIEDLKAFGGLPVYGLAIILAFVYARSLAWQLIAGIIVAYAITSSLRLLFFRVRPDKQKFNSILTKIDAGSFPSLHAMRSALLGTLIYLTVQTPLMLALAVLAMLATAVVRVMQKRHFPSDVTVGLILGVFIAFAMKWFIP